MWNPTTYLRFGDERSRPFFDLVARVDVAAPTEVVDLGCGPGPLTVHLGERWPGARVHGVDSSEEMITAAQALGSTVDFTVGDVRDWRPGPEVDVVVANAVLQWVPGHADLLRRWADELRTGAVIAFQVPGNFDSPSHRSIYEVAAQPRWPGLDGVLRSDAVLDPTGYASLFLDSGCAVDAWETTYVHVLPARDEHPVLRWVEGTALRPVRAALNDTDWADFRAELGTLLADRYPVHNGQVLFPFRRIFVVARVP